MEMVKDFIGSVMKTNQWTQQYLILGFCFVFSMSDTDYNAVMNLHIRKMLRVHKRVNVYRV
jgi:hypothetical protein